ncbi:MAG: hypothetical protein ABW067_15625 [Rhizobacter sp.]
MDTKEIQGLKFFGTEDDSNGHKIATYFLYLKGRPVMRVLVNETVTVEAKSLGGVFEGAPAGIMAGRISIRRVDTEFDAFEPATETSGYALIAKHNDGTGEHADGQTVQAFVYPRIPYLLADLYVPQA